MLSGVESSFWTPYFLDTYLAEKCLKHFNVQGNKFIVEKILLGVEKMTRTDNKITFCKIRCFSAEAYSEPLQTSKVECFCVSS